MEKTCSKCKKEKDISQFSIDKKKKDGHSYVCKECHIIYMNSYYSKNKLRICKDTYKNKKRHRIEKKEKLLSYLLIELLVLYLILNFRLFLKMVSVCTRVFEDLDYSFWISPM